LMIESRYAARAAALWAGRWTLPIESATTATTKSSAHAQRLVAIAARCDRPGVFGAVVVVMTR
jgi:hypothetical protein